MRGVREDGDRLVIGAGTDWDTQNQNPAVARHFGFALLRWRASDAFIAQLLGMYHSRIKYPDNVVPMESHREQA